MLVREGQIFKTWDLLVAPVKGKREKYTKEALKRKAGVVKLKRHRGLDSEKQWIEFRRGRGPKGKERWKM